VKNSFVYKAPNQDRARNNFRFLRKAEYQLDEFGSEKSAGVPRSVEHFFGSELVKMVFRFGAKNRSYFGCDPKYWLISVACFILTALFSQEAAAGAITLGNMASSITKSFTSLAKLISAGSYLAGLGFSIGAIMKFKQHKDNPTQIPIGTPIALVFISAALLFLPTILGITGQTMFGGAGKTAGPTGTVFQ
jgi:intracellular multiplication protein IcmD